MEFKLLASPTLPLQPQLEWVWYSEQTRSFIVGDERTAFAIPVSAPATPVPLQADVSQNAAAPNAHPCNLPIPPSLYEEFAQEPWHGFRFLDRSAYDAARDAAGHSIGDLLRTLVFGPDYEHYVFHPAGGAFLSLRSGSIGLLTRTPTGFEGLDKTRTKGRAALAFCAHPTEMLLAYGDNYGTFHAHRFDTTKFGKATKIVAKERKASRVEFTRTGTMLTIGGMGYLATYAYAAGKFTPKHEVSISVRDFVWLDDERILVNQGLHGLSAYRYDDAGGFTKLAAVKPEGTVQQVSVSKCRGFLAATDQESLSVRVYAIREDGGIKP
jgi:hypothetical protein